MNTEIFLQSLKRHEGKLFGRDEEVQQLHAIFEKAVSEPSVNNAFAVFLHGYSGSGKSMLITHALQHNMPETGYFVYGKYDQQRSSRPYAALTDACHDLCVQLLTREKNAHRETDLKSKREKAIEELEETLVNDFLLLSELIPELGTLLPALQAAAGGAVVPGTFQFDRLKTALINFLASVAQNIPIVLFLDDIQWSDAASIDILRGLLKPVEECTSKVKLLLVGAYRDNELTSGHPLYEPVSTLEKMSNASKIHVSDLTHQSLNLFIASLLKYEETPDVTLQLSKKMHERTHGNIFFVLQFLEMLVTTEILQFSFVTMKWGWDEIKLLEQTNATANVTDLLVTRLRRLPPDTALALIIASQLGNRFDAMMVGYILKQWQDHTEGNLDKDLSASRILHFDPGEAKEDEGEKDDDSLAFLKLPIQEGFIVAMDNFSSGSWYRFLHDKIQSSAAALVSNEKQKSELRIRLGTLLLELNNRIQRQHEKESKLQLPQQELVNPQVTVSAVTKAKNKARKKTWVVLSGVDLLNMEVDSISCHKKRLELIRANLGAARIAASQSAFFPAADYMCQAQSLINHRLLWDRYYDLALEVFTYACEMAYCCGDAKECLKLYQKVRGYRKSQEDSWKASYIAMKSLGSEARYAESADIAFEVLNEAGFVIPMTGATPEDVGMAFEKMLSELSKVTDQEILRMEEEAIDDVSALIWNICSASALFVWHANRPLDHTFICCNMTLRTLRLGLSEYTGQSFALQAISCVVMNHFDLAKRLHGLWSHPEIVQRFTGHEVEAGTMAAGNACSGHMFWPLPRVADGFLKGYTSGMKTGAIEWAMTDAGCFMLTQFLAGTPLPVFETDCWVFVREMKKYGNRIHRPMCEMYLQCALNLMGKADGSSLTILKGEATKEYRMELIMQGKTPDEFPVNVAWFAQLMLSYYFEDFETAVDMAVRHEDFGGLDWPLVWSVSHPYFRGLAYVAKYRLLNASKSTACCGWFTKRKEATFYFKRAMKQLDMLKLYAENGLINAIHMYKILQAEVASVSPGSDPKEVVGLYGDAIRSAARSGFRQDSALAAERLGVYTMAFDKVTAKFRIESAISDYTQWGASAKADLLRSNYPDLDLPDEDEMSARSTSSAGSSRRHRVSAFSADSKHQAVNLTAEICD
ncbi:Transcriptional regulator [Seminavis robusta]|uniref:Transcriptional regulator n=1 Tax=Seminavis robusta TaxID=568900 RepID=A0A9N8EKI1_9STRA|nr:Transcriptional regulator [Seminavis robusta]|eukprot:Sro1337_g264080.1 Transcriptional regulator (1153) ;mRNA; r:4305-7763